MQRFLTLCMAVCLSFQVTQILAQTRFSVVLNQQSNFGDARQSVLFFDADNLGAGPLFSVFTGYEAAANFDEPGSIAVDPDTGDVYLVAFDSLSLGNSPGDLDSGTTASLDGADAEGDYDILRVNFKTVFDHWTANYKGVDVRAPLIVGGPAPTSVDGSLNPYVVNNANLDYVTYGVISPDFTAFNFDVTHSNTVLLAGAVEKLGEVKRNVGDSTGFFNASLEFIDKDTLLMTDDSKEDSGIGEVAALDHSYRILERISTTPGSIPVGPLTAGDNLDGGFDNNGSSESWISRDLGLVNLDFAAGVPIGHSEIESSAYYRDPLTGVRGMWVSESDGGGDDIAFMEIKEIAGVDTFVGYRPHAVGGCVGPACPTSFALDNNPIVDPLSNDGKADNIFVDQDTGDLIIIEGGFLDTADGIGIGDHEPAVIRRTVTSYDNGLGEITFGAWSTKIFLDPNTVATPGDSVAFLERGQWAAYDSVQDLLYFWNPGNGGPEVPEFGLDVWVLDISTGITTAFLDLDDSTSLFQNVGVGDKTDFFTIKDADFDGSGIVNGLDFLIFQRNIGLTGQTDNSNGDANSDGIVNELDLAVWENQYGSAPPFALLAASSSASSVPEPVSVMLLGIGLVLIPFVTRRCS